MKMIIRRNFACTALHALRRWIHAGHPQHYGRPALPCQFRWMNIPRGQR